MTSSAGSLRETSSRDLIGPKAIMQGIEGCQVFILVFSKQANDSDHVYREVYKAFSSRLVVVPFRIEAALPTSGISYYLNTVQWLDAVNPPLDRHISTLIERVKALLAGDTVSDPRLISQSALGPDPAKTRPRRSLGKWAVGFAIVTLCLVALAIADLFLTLSRRANGSDLVTNGPIPAKSIARGVYYGQLKLDPLRDPLRKDPRFAGLLAELAPKR
jgi:hypothetical protein